MTKIKSELNVESINTEDLCIHCIIHQQNLCAKSIKFNNVMTTVISSINFIKARALNHQQFQEFLSDLKADHQDLTFFVAYTGGVEGRY